jgi:hypothetical protein
VDFYILGAGAANNAFEAKKRFPVALPIGKKYFHVRKLVFFVQRMRIVGVSD